MKVEIVNRRKVGKDVYRELSCGHEQLQGSGGKAHLADTAICKTCSGVKKPVTVERVKKAITAIEKAGVDVNVTTVKDYLEVEPPRVRCSHRLQGTLARHTPHNLEKYKFQCPECKDWVCGQCERGRSNTAVCDRCWLASEGVTKPAEPVVVVTEDAMAAAT